MRDAVAEWERSGYGLDDSVESRSVRMGHVENALQRTLARQVIKCESKMTLLGTIISGAPFLGLLGTAWGVMDSFGSMSAQVSVTLNDLAPGVAGALLTTVAGLVVAIPSVFGYNYLSTRTRKTITDMENFASLLADRLELESRAREISSRASTRHSGEIEGGIKADERFYKYSREQTPPESGDKAARERVINFSVEDEDDSPTPRRDFD